MAVSFSGVILDLDGLLLDTERLQYEVGPSVLNGFGHDLSPYFFRDLVGVDRVESARLISLKIGAEIDATALDAAWNDAMDERMKDGIPLRPGVHDFLDALDKHDLPRAIATNSVTERAKWKLAHAGLLNRLDAVVSTLSGTASLLRMFISQQLASWALSHLTALPWTTVILACKQPWRPA